MVCIDAIDAGEDFHLKDVIEWQETSGSKSDEDVIVFGDNHERFYRLMQDMPRDKQPWTDSQGAVSWRAIRVERIV